MGILDDYLKIYEEGSDYTVPNTSLAELQKRHNVKIGNTLVGESMSLADSIASLTNRREEIANRQIDVAPVVPVTTAPKSTPLQAIGYTFLSGLYNVARMFTPVSSSKTDEELDEWDKASRKAGMYFGKSGKAYNESSGLTLKQKEQELTQKADLQNKDMKTKIVASAISSLPVSLVTRIPYVGWILMANQSYRNSLENSRESSMQKGEKQDNILPYVKALGDATLEVGTEMLFPLFGKVGKTLGIKKTLANATKGLVETIFKPTAKTIATEAVEQVAKTTLKEAVKLPVKSFGKILALSATEEGSEEVINAIGSGLLAKVTTEKDAKLFGFADDGESLISFMGVTQAFFSGALMAGAITSTAKGIDTFKNTNKFVDNLNKPVSEITVKDANDYVDAIKEDMQEPINREVLAKAQSDIIENNTSQETKDAISNALNGVQGTDTSTTSTMLENMDNPEKMIETLAENHPLQSAPTIVSNMEQTPLTEAIKPVATKSNDVILPKTKKAKTTTKTTVKKEVSTVAERVPQKERGTDAQWETLDKSLKDSISIDMNKADPELLAYMATTLAEEIGLIKSGYKSKYNVKALEIRLNRMNKIVDDYRTKKQESMKETEDPFDLLNNEPTKPEPIPQKKTPTVEESKTKVIELPYEGDKIVSNREFQEKFGRKAEDTSTTSTGTPTTSSKEKVDKVTVDTKKEPTKTVSEKVTESELVKESQKQDTSGVLGVIPKSLQGTIGFGTDTTNEDAITPKVRERMDATVDKITNTKTWKEKIKSMKDVVVVNTQYGSVGINPNLWGDIRQAFRGVRIADRMASQTAENIISLAYNKAGKNNYKLMSDAILFYDMLEDINKGRYKSGDSLPFGLTVEMVIKKAEQLKEQLALPKNAIVVEAIATRKTLMDETRAKLVKAGKEAGQDLSIVYSKKDYLYHATVEYFLDANDRKKTNNKSKKIVLKERIGSNLDFIAAPEMADFIVLRSMEKQIAKLNLYNAIKKTDKTKTLPLDENGQPIIPDGYKELSPADLGVVTFTKHQKQKTEALALKTMTTLGIDRKSKEGKRILRKMLKEARKSMLIVPTEIANAVESEFKQQETIGGNITKRATNVWKYSKLRLPFMVWKYNIRNMASDLNIVFEARPSTLLKMPQAIGELFGFYYKNQKLTPMLNKFIEITGLATGEYVQDLKTMRDSKMFKFYEKDTSAKSMTKDVLKKIWSKLTLETETEFREQILRYAAFLSFHDELSTNGTGLPKYYTASIPGEIQTISDVFVRSAKLANDMMGAYDDTSILGKYTADHIIPFYRWNEVQVKRYYRLVKNAFYAEPDAVKTAGLNAAGKIGMAGRIGATSVLRLGKLALGATLFYGAIQLSNLTFAPDEEEKLPEDLKNRPHLTIPSWAVGGDNGRVYYLDRLGASADLMNMFGIDFGIRKDLQDIIEGRMSYDEKLKEMALSPIYQLFNSSSPGYKTAFELLTGKIYYPNPSKPRVMKDMWEYLFGQVGLSEEYKKISGKAIVDGSYFKQKQSILFNSVYEGDVAYWDLMDLKDRWYRIADKSAVDISDKYPDSTDSKRKEAMYYYKQALKLNDTKAAERYMKEFVFYGGTDKKMKDSLEATDPLYGMKNKDKKEFVAWLKPEEKLIYDKAMGYYKETLATK